MLNFLILFLRSFALALADNARIILNERLRSYANNAKSLLIRVPNVAFATRNDLRMSTGHIEIRDREVWHECSTSHQPISEPALKQFRVGIASVILTLGE